MKKFITLFITGLSLTIAASAQYYQQHPKITATGLPAAAQFGEAVSLSADASTAIVGAWGGVNGAVGQAVILNRNSNNTWSQGQILIGTDAIGGAQQGSSVAISGDGNTAIVGGPSDDNNAGAAWIFTRSAGTWTEQAKLVGNDATGKAFQGFSVSISGDGNTVIIGGPWDNEIQQITAVGAAWVFKRSGNNWIQQGAKLLGSGSVGAGQQGFSVALNYSGDRAVVGAISGKNPGGYSVGGVCIYGLTGAGWVQETYTYSSGGIFGLGASVALSSDGSRAVVGRPGASGGGAGVGDAIIMDRSSSGTWTSTASIQGTLPVGLSQQGESVAISADGTTVVIGGGAGTLTTNASNIGVGASWVFKYDGSNWVPEGQKYVGTGATGNSQQGHAVAMSADGNTFITGGFGDDNKNGAVWVFSKTIPPITAVNETALLQVKVYPNPAQNIINIKSPVKLSNELLSMDGKVLIERNEKTELDISALPAGVYVLTLYDEKGVRVKTEKIIRINN